MPSLKPKTNMEAGDTKTKGACLSLEMSERPLNNGHKKAEYDKAKTGDRRVTLWDIAVVVLSLMTCLIDTVTDVLVAAQYFHVGDFVFGGLTIGFVILPSIIVQCFSGRWYAADEKMKGCRSWLIHIFMLQPLERYLYVIVAGFEARRDKKEELVNEYFYQHNDVSMLRLFEAFLESAPQLALQFYIILYSDHANWLTGLSACISLLAVGWAVAAYSHALRKAYRESYQPSWPSLIVQTLWHIGVVAARVISLVVFTSVFKYWVCLVIGFHWFLMTVWVVLQKTDFCPSRCEEFLVDCTIGLVYGFSFFNLKEGRSRYRVSVYYLLVFAENSALVVLWYLYREEGWYDVALLASASALFTTGVICMILYYRFCHPSGPIYCRVKSHRVKDEKEVVDVIDLPLSRPPVYQSTPSVRQAQRVIAVSPLADTPPRPAPAAGPRVSTTSLPARRGLLKSQLSSRLDVLYQPVTGGSPAQLSPIKACHSDAAARNLYADCTNLQLDETSVFHHYSVDASACFRVSRCNTLEGGTGVDLSRGSLLDGEASPCGDSPQSVSDHPSTVSERPSTDSGHSTDHSLTRQSLDFYKTPIDLSLWEARGTPDLQQNRRPRDTR